MVTQIQELKQNQKQSDGVMMDLMNTIRKLTEANRQLTEALDSRLEVDHRPHGESLVTHGSPELGVGIQLHTRDANTAVHTEPEANKEHGDLMLPVKHNMPLPQERTESGMDLDHEPAPARSEDGSGFQSLVHGDEYSQGGSMDIDIPNLDANKTIVTSIEHIPRDDFVSSFLRSERGPIDSS